MRRILVLLCAACCLGVGAQPLALPPPPHAQLVERPGAQLPLALPLRDADGAATTLAQHFPPGTAVLLVPGAYRCQALCGLLMQGLMQALRDTGLPRSTWRIVRVSLAPADTPQDAQARRDVDLAYGAFVDGAQPAGPWPLELLLADGPSARALATAAGFDFEQMQDGQLAHPATVIVATPAGVVARYFNGVAFDAGELRQALREAAAGRGGGVSGQLALLCAHFAPVIGRHGAAVLQATRVLGLLTLLGLAFAMRRRRPRAGEAP